MKYLFTLYSWYGQLTLFNMQYNYAEKKIYNELTIIGTWFLYIHRHDGLGDYVRGNKISLLS